MAAVFDLSWTTPNLTGHVDYKVLYRSTGSSLWTSFLTSGTTATLTLNENILYDIEIQNINNFDNAICPIAQAIKFTDPFPIISATNSSVAYSFTDLSSFITSYTVTIALESTPGTILQTQILVPAPTNIGTFTGLLPTTRYILTITPVAAEISRAFSYTAVTSEFATCGTPTSPVAYLTSGTSEIIHISWTDIAVIPACGYNVYYRPKSITSAYSSLTTSGTTSGTTSVTVSILAPASYEGYILANCCSDSISDPLLWGVNARLPISMSVSVNPNPLTYSGLITSLYANPYGMYLTGSFNDSVSGYKTFSSILYPANSTSATVSIPGTPSTSGSVITNVQISVIDPVFDNGGSLQQLDPVSTPAYFGFLITSGSTAWNGSPTSLPSFTLDRFTVTEQSTATTVLAGTLNVSWIYDSLFGAGAIPYDTVTLQVYDTSNNLMGSRIVSTSPLGLRSTSIPMTLQAVAITPTNQFRMVARWSDTSIINTLPFYLPLF